MKKSKADTVETRKRILSTASGMFLRNGIAGTAISDVMVAAGLTSGGFYRHFESKEHLLAESNATAFDEVFASFDAAAAGKPPREAFDTLVHAYLHQLQATNPGSLCPLANLSNELRHSDEQVKAVLLAGYARFVKLLASYLMRLDYVDYMGLASSIVATLVGAVSISQLAVDAASAEPILANAQNTVSLLLRAAEKSTALGKSSH